MSDNIVVALRLRPFISRELNEENEKYWEAQENCIVQYEPTTKKQINSYAFDEVFDVDMSNEKIYNDLAHPIVQSGLAGFNGTIFAYGQTSSGKTYTMTGTSSTLGIIPMAIQNIFSSIENMPDREFLLRASYMEIYQENIYDLLTGEKITTVREDAHGQVIVLGLKEVCVINEDMLLAVMSGGDKRRKVGETNMNERSSRSHSIFRLIIESKERGDKDCQGAITVSHLNLVDLAGSENASQTGAVGERLKEGGSINKSLFMLGRVISQLSEGEQHINFRDSKLTRILQNSLGGNAKTVIICTVTPANKEQTLSTVRFACRAKNIKNKPIINEVVSDQALLKRYALEIKRLRQALENERNTDKAQEMEQVKEKLDEQEKQNMELNGKIIALKEKLVVSSHPHVSSNAVDLKKRRMTWAAPVFRKPLRMSLGTCSPLTMLKGDVAFIPFGNRNDDTCEAVEKPTVPQGDSSLYCISEEEQVMTPDEIPQINISTCSFEGNPEAEALLDENEISKLLDDCFISPKAVAPRRRKKVRFSSLPKPNIDVACQTEEIVNLSLTPNLLLTPTKVASSPACLTPEGQTPREILRSRVRSLKEILDTKEIALHEWQDEMKELEVFHRDELQELMGTYEEYKELGEKIEYLKKSLEDSEGLCLEANKRIHEQVEDIKVLKDQVNSLEKERNDLRKQTLDLQNYSEEVHTLRKECKEKTALIEKLQNEKIDFDMKMELALQKQKETESYLRKSLEDAWEESAQYEKGLNTESLERKSIFKSFEEELEKKKEQLDAFMLEKENLSKALKSAEEEVKVTKDELKKMTATNEELANEIVSLQNKNYSFQRNRIGSTVSENQRFKELNDTLFTCEEPSMVEQTCIMSSSILTSQNEVSRRLSETIQYLDESLSSALLSPESDLKDVVGIKEELCKLKEMLMRQEFLQGAYSQEVFALDNIPQSSLSFEEFRIKNEYTSYVEKLHLLESIYEDFIQYSHNVYSSPPVIHMHENLKKIPGDKSSNSSRDKNYEVTDFSFCDETMNLSLYSQIGNGLNLADELKVADSNQTLVDDGKCSSLADELHEAESNRTLVDDDKCSSFPFKKEDNESFIKEKIDMDSSVLKREACNDCHHCCEKEKVLINLNQKIILQNEISDKLQAEVKILQKREKELENELNVKSGKQKDLENELNIIKKKEKDLIGDLLRRETDLKNMEFEMKETKEQHSCTILEMRTKENGLLVQIEKLKEKEGEYLNELNELREKEEEVESMIMEFLEKEKSLEEKKNKLDKETNRLKDELLENSTTINDLKLKIVDYEKELEILRSQKYDSCKVEEKKGCDCELVPDSDSINHMKLELNRLTKDLVEKENLLQETEKELKKNVKELEDKLLEKSDAISNLEFEVNDCKKELEMYKTQKSDGFLIEEEKEIRRSSLIVPSSDCSIELEVQRLTKELLEKENLLEEKEREFIDKINTLEDDLKEKFRIINKLDSELADCKKELEILKAEKPDFANTTEKENHNTSILVLPSSEPKETEIRKLTEEKEALQRELEVFQEIISSLELESTTREMELDHAKQELNLARCKIKDLTTLHNSLSKKLNQTETLVESVHEDISKVRLKKSEDSESYDANMDKKGSVNVGDVTQLNKESEDKTDRVDKLTKNEIEYDSSKLSKDIFDDDSNTKLRENIIESLTEVTISEDQKLNSFLAEHCVKSSEDLEKMLNQIGLVLKKKQEEIEILKLEKREKKEEIKEDYDVINNGEREKLLDEVKQKDKICEELNYELENLKELFRKLENENINNRETLEKLNRLLQRFNLTGIEGIETVLKEALSPSNDLKLNPKNIESKSVKCSKTSSCLQSSEHLNPNVDIAVEHTREVCDSSNINVSELVTTDHEVLKTSESLSSSSLEKFEDSRIEDIEKPDILPKTNKSCHELNISKYDKLEIELFSENLQEKSLNNTKNNLETAENSKRGKKSLEILDDIDDNYSLKYKILEEEVNSKQKEIDSVLEEMEKCKRNILALEEVNGKLKSELNYNKDTIDSLLKELDHFKNLNTLVSEEKSKLLIEIEGNLKVCEEKDCEIKRLSFIVKELEIKIDVKVKDYIILKEKVEKIEAVLRLHNIEDVDCIEKALSEKASMHLQLSKIDQDCNTLKEKVVSLVENQERMAILSVELDELKKAFDEKVREEVNMITEIKKNIDIITEKDNEIKTNKETIDSLKSDNEEMNKKNISLREELNAYDELLMSHGLQGTTDLEQKLAAIELFKESNREKDEMNRSLKEKLCKYDEILTLYNLENTENLKEELNRINSLIVSNEEKEKNIKFINAKVIEIESLLKYHNLQGINDLDVELRKYKDILQELKEKNDECNSLKCEVKDYFAVKEGKELLSVEVELLRKEKEIYFVKEKELNNEIMKKIALQEEYEIQIEKLEKMVKDLQMEKESNPKKDRLEKLNIILNTYNVFDIENLEKTLRNVKDLSEELSLKNQECKELKHDMDILFTDQATLVETLQERQIALEEHTNALKERDEAIKTLETDLDDLKRVHEECAEKAMKDTLEIENYINIIEKYEFEMTEKEEKSQKIVKENEIMTNDISDLNSKLKICQETETFFRDENRRLKLELLESVKKIKALEKDLKELNLEYSNLKGEHQQMDINVFNSKIKQYQESEALFRDENSRLKMELLDSAGKHEALEKDLKDLRVEYNNLKDKHQATNGNEPMVELNIKLNTLQSENHDLNSEAKNLREQLNEEKNKSKSLDEELDNLDKYYKDCIESYICTVKDLKNKNKTLDESLKSYKKMKTTNSENVSMDTVVDSKNTSNSEEIRNLKSESRKLSNLVSKLQEENRNLKSSKNMHTTNYENVSMDTVVDSKNISNSEEFYNIQSENRKLANLVSSLQSENELLKKQKAQKNQEVQTEKDSIDGDEPSLKEQIFNLKKDNNVLKIQLQAIQAPIKNEAQRWKDELKFEQEKNKKLMSELRRVRNENCDSSIINAPSNNEVKGSSRGGEQACGFGSGVVLDIQVMRLKNANYHLEKEKEKMQNEIAKLKENVEWYKGKGSEWKTKCFKEEQKVQKLTQKLKNGDELKNICSVDKTPAEHKAINAQEKEEILKPTPKLKLDDEPKIKNDVDITPAEHNQKNIKEIDLQISGPKYSSTSNKKSYSTAEELSIKVKASKEGSLIEPCVLQEAPQNTPLPSVEKLRHTKNDEGATASGKENQTRKVRECRKSDECKVQ